MNKLLASIVDKLGYTLSEKKIQTCPDIQDADFREIYQICKPFTMTGEERMYALYNAVQYIIKNNIEGDFVECGVWRGGSSLLVALALKKLNVTNRKIYLFDTFEGMSEPTNDDVDLEGAAADTLLAKTTSDKENSVWCLASIQDVQKNLRLSDYPSENIVYVKGKVEDTIPEAISFNKIALLRLDTDWYESTKHELIHLYPKLNDRGVLIIDDYGHWAGCRKAVDEYIRENSLNIFLNRIDYTGRLALKV